MFDDRSPIYRQIADQIKDDVLRGVLAADDQVMSTNQYAAYYRINPATAARAFQQLVDEGVIYKRRGVGMFVHAGAREQIRTSRRERFFAEVLEPMAAEARALGVPVADIVARLHQLIPGDSR
ncbi:GntR family transcriptional regulator [Actinoplanes sp. NPDC026670]|uniref:GntR family transcriptional regulator n=1 Tax=Actinoplanes sp. NPDC026670 TaxID=3154700 RepID=UPI0033FC66CE